MNVIKNQKSKIKNCLFFLMASCILLSSSVVNAQTNTRLKVLCYNLRFGELASLEELATFIEEQDPDVVALQEVDVRTNRPAAPHQNGLDFITELGFRTGMLPAYGKTIPHLGGYYGIGILSKYPMSSIRRVYLPHPVADGSREQRAVLVADIEYADNQYFTFAVTHLDNSNTEVRQAQVARINEILKARQHPVIIAGDFNAIPSSTEISEGMSDWKPLCNSDPTFPANNPNRKIDYIFCFPKDRWEEVQTQTMTDVQLSDHLPVSAEVELK